MDSTTQAEIMPEEKMSQTTSDQEIQTAEKCTSFDEDDKFIIASLHQMIKNLMRFRSRSVRIDDAYKRAATRFERTDRFLDEHNYWENVSQSEEDETSDEGQGPVTRQQSAQANYGQTPLQRIPH